MKGIEKEKDTFVPATCFPLLSVRGSLYGNVLLVARTSESQQIYILNSDKNYTKYKPAQKQQLVGTRIDFI
jgi:ATP-dependent phosphoenolpyruvate carboxykinase